MFVASKGMPYTAARAPASRSASASAATCGKRMNEPASPACSRLVHIVVSAGTGSVAMRAPLLRIGSAKTLLQTLPASLAKALLRCQARPGDGAHRHQGGGGGRRRVDHHRLGRAERQG